MAIASVRENVSVKLDTKAQRANKNVPEIAMERCALNTVNAVTLIGKLDNLLNRHELLNV